MRKDPAHLLKFTQGSDPAKKVSVDLVCDPWVLTISLSALSPNSKTTSFRGCSTVTLMAMKQSSPMRSETP
jgi:hypothetical protein